MESVRANLHVRSQFPDHRWLGIRAPSRQQPLGGAAVLETEQVMGREDIGDADGVGGTLVAVGDASLRGGAFMADRR
jgi:hypothetical protein